MSKRKRKMPAKGEIRGNNMLTITETYMLSEVLDIFEKKFAKKDEAISSVFDYDDEYVDIEILFADDSTEQFAVERSQLSSKKSAKEVASTIS